MPKDNQNEQLVQERRNAVVALVEGKKKESTKQDVVDFEQAWISYANMSGIDDDAVKLLLDGFSIAGALPLFKLIGSDDSQERLKSLRKCTSVKENTQGAAFRLHMHLLALYLNQGGPVGAIDYLIHTTPRFAVNKAGDPFGTNFSTVRKYLVRTFDPKKAENSFDGIECLPGDFARFSSLVSPVLAKMKDDAKLSKRDRASVEILTQWLSAEEMIASEGRRKDEGSSFSQEQVSRKSATTIQDKADFDNVIALLVSLRDEDRALKRKVESLGSEMIAERNASKRKKEEAESLRSELEATKLAYEKQALALQSAKGEIERLSKKIEMVEEDARNQASLVSMLDGDQSRKSEAVLNKIASKLRTDYDDYVDSVEMEMDKDLGENMRLQLGEVFKVLKSAGVPL